MKSHYRVPLHLIIIIEHLNTVCDAVNKLYYACGMKLIELVFDRY